MLPLPEQHPQNPYRSVAVIASAGSGKTYQLSRRFLALVAAGSDPAKILTITFTRKAAAEMRHRILKDAAELSSNRVMAEEFECNMRHWHQQAKQASTIRSAQETSRIILAAASRLRISTIDSVLYDWLRRYPVQVDTTNAPSLDLGNPLDLEQLSQETFGELLRDQYAHWNAEDHSSAFLQEVGLNAFRGQLSALKAHDGIVWQRAQSGRPALIPIPLPEPPLCGPSLDDVREDLKTLANDVNESVRDHLLDALSNNDLHDVLQSKLFTKERAISGVYIKGAKRAKYADQISRIDPWLLYHFNVSRVELINARASFMLQAYRDWQDRLAQCKQQQGILEFSDLLKATCSVFFGSPDQSVQFSILQGLQHLLLDEFQDTSPLQWALFRSLSNEMLAGTGLQSHAAIRPTVFIVGDPKQSIYGFREAEPALIAAAKNFIVQHEGAACELSESYRTAPLILDLVNQVFHPNIAGFPNHRAAKRPDGTPVGGSFAHIEVYDPLYDKVENEVITETGLEQEARLVAQRVASLIADTSERHTRPEDIAILYRNKSHKDLIQKNLAELGISSASEDDANFFEHPTIRDALAMLEWIARPDDSTALLTLLRSPFMENSAETLSALADRLGSLAAEKILPQLSSAGFADVQNRLHAWRELFAKNSPAAALIKIRDQQRFMHQLTTSGANEAAVEDSSIRFDTLIDLVREFERNGQVNVWQICCELRALSKHESLSPKTPLASGAVRMMTIHKSKGLEFPIVFVCGLTKEWGGEDRYWLKYRDETNAEFMLQYLGKANDRPKRYQAFEDRLQTQQDEQAAEELRVLYVALTRAKHTLICTGSLKAQPKEDAPPSVDFLAQIQHAASQLGANAAAFGEFSMHVVKAGSLAIARSEGSKPADTYAQNPIPALRWGIITVRPHALTAVKATPARVESDTVVPFVTHVGTAFHRCVELFLKNEPFDIVAEFENLVGSQPWPADATMSREQLHARLRNEVAQCTGAALLNHLKVAPKGTEILPEREFIFRQDNDLVRGFIDLLVIRNNEAEIYDYKYSTAEPTVLLEQYRGQLEAYRTAVASIFPQHTVRAHIVRLPDCSVSPAL